MFLLKPILFIRILLISLFVLSPYNLFSKNIDLNYEVNWNSLHIANINWSAFIEGDNYIITNDINSNGFFSKLYPYNLKSSTIGNVFDNTFFPISFKYFSQTKKKNKNVSIKFNKNGIVNDYQIFPLPEEIFINNFDDFKEDNFFIDPISQLFQYFLYQTSSNKFIIDGRRIYSVKSKPINPKNFDKSDSIGFKGEALGLEITFPYYLSLWKNTDEDANNMEYIRFYYSSIESTFIPLQIIIKTNKVKVFLNLSAYNIDN